MKPCLYILESFPLRFMQQAVERTNLLYTRKAQTSHILRQARDGPYIPMVKSAPKAQLQRYIGLALYLV